MNKLFISANDLLKDSFRLANEIKDTGYEPDIIIGIWRGGAPVAIAVHEYFEYLGSSCEHMPLRTSSYTGIDQQEDVVEIHGLDYLLQRLDLLEHLDSPQNILLVDDVFDTGRTIDAIIEALNSHVRKPTNIKVATPWYKPSKNQTERTPDYFLYETSQWLVFPHELQGLDTAELRNGKPEFASAIRSQVDNPTSEQKRKTETKP